MGGEEGNQGRKLVLVPSGQSSNMQVGRGQHGGADAAGQSRESSKVVVETKVAGWELRPLLGVRVGQGWWGQQRRMEASEVRARRNNVQVAAAAAAAAEVVPRELASWQLSESVSASG